LSAKIDLTGKTFGRLLVIEEDINKSIETKRIHWLCQCECDNPNKISVSASALVSGNTKSCGCYRKEIHSNPNKYDLLEDGSIKGYSNNSDNYFVIDEIDFEKIKNLSWREDKDGYFVSAIRTGEDAIYLKLHRYILEDQLTTGEKEIVDHRNTLDKWDNRRSNLRITDGYGNAQNRKIHKNNTSGVPGVHYLTKSEKWIVSMQCKYYGSFSNKYEAFLRSKSVRTEVFGEYNSIDWDEIERTEFPKQYFKSHINCIQ